VPINIIPYLRSSCFVHSLSSINTSFEALDLLTYPIKHDALHGFSGEDLALGVDQRNFTYPHVLLGILVLCTLEDFKAIVVVFGVSPLCVWTPRSRWERPIWLWRLPQLLV
jgi:hypothetical protein